MAEHWTRCDCGCACIRKSAVTGNGCGKGKKKKTGAEQKRIVLSLAVDAVNQFNLLKIHVYGTQVLS